MSVSGRETSQWTVTSHHHHCPGIRAIILFRTSAPSLFWSSRQLFLILVYILLHLSKFMSNSVRSLVVAALKKSVFVFWDVSPSCLVGIYQHFGETRIRLCPRNAGTFLQVLIVLQRRSSTSASRVTISLLLGDQGQADLIIFSCRCDGKVLCSLVNNANWTRVKT
jgi:hypothetical protein